MSPRSTAVVARHELRLFRCEPGQIAQMLVAPVVMIAFLTPAFEPAMRAAGHTSATGAEHAVPGMVTMFSFFAAGLVGFAFFREHGWGTWNRLRASQARPFEIAAGKATPPVLLVLTQQAALFVLGVTVFGLHIRGAVAGVVLVSVALTLCLTVLGVLFAAVLRSSQQLNTVSNLTVMVLAGLGGAFTPISVLPGWAQALAPLTPTFWAMEGYRTVILDGAGVAAVALPCGVLLAFAAGFTAVAVRRFSFDETKHVNG